MGRHCHQGRIERPKRGLWQRVVQRSHVPLRVRAVRCRRTDQVSAVVLHGVQGAGEFPSGRRGGQREDAGLVPDGQAQGAVCVSRRFVHVFALVLWFAFFFFNSFVFVCVCVSMSSRWLGKRLLSSGLFPYLLQKFMSHLLPWSFKGARC